MDGPAPVLAIGRLRTWIFLAAWNVGLAVMFIVMLARTVPSMPSEPCPGAWKKGGSGISTGEKVGIGGAAGTASLSIHADSGPQLSMHGPDAHGPYFSLAAGRAFLDVQYAHSHAAGAETAARLHGGGRLVLLPGSATSNDSSPGLSLPHQGSIIFGDPSRGEGFPVASIRLDDLGQLVVHVGGSERPSLTVTAEGRVGINLEPNSSPTATLEVRGNIKARAFLQTSDSRLKRDIREIDPSHAMRCVSALRGWRYEMDDGRTHAGLIAQEVMELIPEAVFGDPSDYDALRVDYTAVAAYLTAAYRELESRCAGRRFHVSSDSVGRADV